MASDFCYDTYRCLICHFINSCLVFYIDHRFKDFFPNFRPLLPAAFREIQCLDINPVSPMHVYNNTLPMLPDNEHGAGENQPSAHQHRPVNMIFPIQQPGNDSDE